MIDPATVAVGWAATSAIGAGVNLYQMKKNNEYQKQLQRQRKELLIVEAVSAISVITTFVENQIWKKKYMRETNIMNSRIQMIEQANIEINNRLNHLNLEAVAEGVSNQNSKLDILINTMATQPSSTTSEDDNKK